MSMIIESATNRVIDSGKDKHLGRWSWITLRGKNNIRTTLISGYRPTANHSTPNTVFRQQQRYLAATQTDKCPLQLWLDDMETLVKSKLSNGHQVVLAADVNDPVKEPLIQRWAQQIDLREAVSRTTTFDVPTHFF